MNPYGIPVTPEVEELKRFLASAPGLWSKPDDPPIRQYQMSNGELISCIFWRGKFFVTGTDIVKILLFRFTQAGRPVLNVKKFEEGIFSDLRNLKPGTEAILEEPRSDFLEFLFKHGCIRTQKKQKVFFWYSVPHESLFLDAFERDFKREGSLYHMNFMMNQNRYLQKQMALLQATALQQQMGPTPSGLSTAAPSHHGPLSGNPALMMAPQMMPNSAMNRPMLPYGAPPSINAPSQMSSLPSHSSNNGNYMLSNTVDPFLLGPQMRMMPSAMLNNKMPLNPVSHSNQTMLQQPQPRPAFNFDVNIDYDATEDGAASLLDDPLLLGSYDDTAIDPSRMMSLHEY